MGLQILPAIQGQQFHNFIIALEHAVLRTAGLAVVKRRGIQRPHVQLLLGMKHIGNGKLVVNLIVGIRVQHHVHAAFRGFQLAK